MGRIDIVKLHPAAITVRELSRWLEVKRESDLPMSEVGLAPSIRESAHRWLSIAEFKWTERHQAELANGTVKPRAHRTLEIIEIGDDPHEKCSDAAKESATVVSCKSDDRIFVWRKVDTSSAIAEDRNELFPEQDFEVIAKAAAAMRP
jgi:predicted P-loop ATPase